MLYYLYNGIYFWANNKNKRFHSYTIIYKIIDLFLEVSLGIRNKKYQNLHSTTLNKIHFNNYFSVTSNII